MVISIKEATYKGNYKIKFVFSNGVQKVVDFSSFLKNSKNPMTNKYLDKDKFKSFSLDYGDIIWNDYELCFPIWDLYKGRL
ncbi:MAG: DUF2442 domain-containing protein [Bacteroidia bacterium]|nr:DUF2442 domain-containing protein [Bacteroidia bacterium]